MSRRLLQILLIIAIFGALCFAQQETVILKNLILDDVEYAGFILHQERTIHITAIGAGGNTQIRDTKEFQLDPENMFAYAWILDHQSRQLVWRMTIDNTKKIAGAKFNRKFDGEITLPPGIYELYFAAFKPSFFNFDGGFVSFKQLLQAIFEKRQPWNYNAEDWMIEIEGVDEALDRFDVKKLQNAWLDKTVAHLVKQKDNRLEHTGFSLKKAADLMIYALGEGSKGKMYDYGWVIKAKTHERIWLMEENQTKYAGGAWKNKMVKTVMHFPPGNYLVYYKTDNSHSYQKWNANPPYDPSFWGIVLKPVDKNFDWKTVSKYEQIEEKAIVALTRIGDYAYVERFFKVIKPTHIRIYALGEGRAGNMYDYGWITRAEDGKLVWKMNYDDTKHAGGSSKNRLFDGVLSLQPGTYIVHYQSDDSHSYEEWNARPPQNPEMWGITIYNLGIQDAVQKIKPDSLTPKKILAKLIKVGDDEYLRKDFYLNKPSSVRIYCLGEGDLNGMYDYGWIKNMDTGQIVWKMRYSHTVHAGGADKNRLINTVITLPAGHYRVFYRSDGSHSYRRWNAPAPYDERNWGITLYLVK